MARTVADTALLAGIMAGRHPGDHASLPGGSIYSVPEAPEAVASLAGMRIALCIQLGNYDVAPDVETNTRGVCAALRDAGAIVEEIQIPWTAEHITETIFTHFGYLLGPAMEDSTADSPELLAAYTRRFIADARRAAQQNRYLDGIKREARLQYELVMAMAGFEALICPVSAVSALEADGLYLDGIETRRGHLQHYWQGHMTAPFNIANRCPVIAVPSGIADCGIPTGVQIVGHPFVEDTVFRLASAIEALRPWSARHPATPIEQ